MDDTLKKYGDLLSHDRKALANLGTAQWEAIEEIRGRAGSALPGPPSAS